ncbi:unnamed protein product [Kluyveromyces dobzhanskii CBS 2104]|uniref:WGS project CCBQ000000000 data, contig 00017 n=1 Tax=Kluyveromyces dobzhanskii CBS 2104 TaxID=1427455 RepID=A0A0A8L5Y6_9SACH|nr:unnamed protein product [Kluyveromyces dobzhanskii CBS 2104]
MESTIEPCKVRTLVVPIGTWKKDAYLAAVEELDNHCEIRLVDVTPLPNCTFNPQVFPHGRVLYSFQSREYDSNSMMFLHDFEPYRKLFVVIGLCNDGALSADMCIKELQERYGSAISYAVIYNERSGGTEEPTKHIFSKSDEPLETIMCDITRNFLESLDVYYSSYKHVTLRSPGAIGGPSVLKTTLTGKQIQTGSLSSAPSKRINTQSTRIDSSSSSLSLSDEPVKEKSKRYSSLNALSGSSDKSMQRSKARQLKLLANLQLLTGQYTTSMANFAEAARILYKIHDYIWLASSLEGIVTTMILLSYLQIPFQVPPIIHSLCSLSQNATSVLSPSASRRNSMQSLASPRNSVSTITAATLDVANIDVPKLIKTVADKALYYYDYSLSYSVEFTPQVVYCKSILRTLTFMSLCYKSNGFNRQALRRMIFPNGLLRISPEAERISEDENTFSKSEIYQYSMKLFELQLKLMDLPSQIQTYLSLSLIYDNLNMLRKKAFVQRILFISILSHLSKDYISENYQDLINDLLKTYRITGWEPEHKIQDASSYNWVTLQKNVLMLIIKVSTHFKNYKNVVEYSQILLKRFSHTLTELEQRDLLNQNILPYQNGYSVEYMDPFLVRDVSFSRTRLEEMPMLKVLDKDESTSVNDTHQIFNPFATVHHKTKENETEEANYFLVAENVQMIITFQNPFKFDVKINSVNFTKQDSRFMKVLDPELTSFTIPASSRRQFCVGVTFIEPTPSIHQLDGLMISVFGLSPKFWSICKKLEKFDVVQRCSRRLVPITIIDQQPTLSFLSTTLVDNRVMLLDGTQTDFKIFLRNSSLSSPINYCNISWTTNIEVELKENYWVNLSPDDLYDIDSQLQWLNEKFISISSIPDEIGINESVQLDVKLDVTRAPFSLEWVKITIQYGFKKSDDDEAVYVKSLTIPLNITLQRTLEVSNVNFVPIPDNFEEISEIPWISHLQKQKDIQTKYILMLIDMRNSWLLPVSFVFNYEDYSSEKERLDSNETRRFVVPIRRIETSSETSHYSNKPIPRIDKTKQYITSGLTLSQENDMREAFWCREHILDCLKCTWNVSSNLDAKGSVEFRQFMEKFDKQVIRLVYPASNTYDIKVTASETTVKVGTPVRLNIIVNTRLKTDLVPIRYSILDYFTGKSVLNDHPKSVVFQGQTSTMVKPRTPVDFNILPLKRAKFQIDFEVPGNILTRELITITVE